MFDLSSYAQKLKFNFDNNSFSIKDPSPIFDGTLWHIYATGPTLGELAYGVLHLISKDPLGPWSLGETVKLHDIVIPNINNGISQVCAPGVVYNSKTKYYHMFIQTHFNMKGGMIEHLSSKDGVNFYTKDIPLITSEESFHAGIYDPQPELVHNSKYIVYSSFHRVGHGNIFLVEGTSWNGPWKHHGRILSHKDLVDYHNQQSDKDYEWGLEGAQIIGLPNGQTLLLGVCFLPHQDFGTRQRVFITIGDRPLGPYRVVGLPLNYPLEWECLENGHPGAIIVDSIFYLYFQYKSNKEQGEIWKLGVITISVDKLIDLINNA